MTKPLDVVELLTSDHRLLQGLLARFEEENDPAELRLLFARLVEEISSHEAAEQQVVFPSVCTSVPSAERAAMERLAEHEEINELLAEMRELNTTTFGFEKRACALVLELQRHLELEEEEVFPVLRAALSRNELVALADRVRALSGTTLDVVASSS